MAFYLAVDLGTTGCRSLIFDETLNIKGSSYEEYGLIAPQDKYVEQDAALWWELTLKTAKKAISLSEIDPQNIEGISISSQGITVVPVDKSFTPLCNALNWLDTRAFKETETIGCDFGDNFIFKHTGKKNTPAYTLPKLLWIKKNMPDIWEKTYKFLMPMDYLTAMLTGECVTDYSMASGTLFYDCANRCWSEVILKKYGIDPKKLPEIKESGSPAGKVRPEIAKKLGLSENCTVSVGAQDQKCAAFGVGLDENTVTISLGTAAAITRLWNEYCPDKCANIGWCGYTNKDKWVTEGVIGTAGTALRWIRDLMFKNENYGVIDAEAEIAINKNTNVMFFPYLSGPTGPEYYKDSCGVLYGMSLATERGDIAAAVMEGIAFRIRLILEAMDAYSSSKKIILFGGGAKGVVWPQIIADITGLDIITANTAEAASAGAAMLAAKGCGKTLDALKYAKTFHPSLKKDYYKEKYRKYLHTEKNMWLGGK